MLHHVSKGVQIKLSRESVEGRGHPGNIATDGFDLTG